MSNNIKILRTYTKADLSSPDDLYVPVSPRTALISSITLNAGAGTPTVLLKAVSGTSSAIFHRATLSTSAPVEVPGLITLGAGDKLTIQAATGTVNVSVIVLGMERD